MNATNANDNDQGLKNNQSSYYTIEEFNTEFNSQRTGNQENDNSLSSPRSGLNDKYFSILHINARSLNKNFDSLELLLAQLHQFPFSIIGISETWLHSTSPPVFNLDNYQLLRSDRKHGKGGGVAMYTRSNLKNKLRPDLHIEGSEDLFIEMLNDKGKNVIVGVIYRPPNHNLDNFLSKLDEFLSIIAQENKEVYLMGDYNIDLLSTENNNTLKLVSVLSSYAFTPHIHNPTRISITSRTLIDNIFSNVINKNVANGVLFYDILDHLPIFSLCSQPEPQKKMKMNKPSKKRKESDRNIDSLNFDLAQEGWDSVLNETDANRAYDIFIKKLTFYFNKNIPLVNMKSFRKNRQPWVTKGISRSITSYTKKLLRVNAVNN